MPRDIDLFDKLVLINVLTRTVAVTASLNFILIMFVLLYASQYV
jgi:hypothetical protein